MKRLLLPIFSLITALSFISCEKEETNILIINGTPDSTTEELVQIILNNGNIESATRSDEATAVGLFPDVSDVKFMFFVSNTVVAESGIISLTNAVTQDVSIKIPSNTDAVMAVCNTSLIPSYFKNKTIGKTLSEVNAWLFELSAQTHPITGVAITGYTTTIGSTITIDLYPVVSRIEIGKVTVDMTGVSTSDVDYITLESIYINNYDKYVGLDKTSVSTNPVNHIEYGISNLDADGRLPNLTGMPRYERIMGYVNYTTAITSMVWTPVNGVWGNQVLPVIGSVPHVIFQFKVNRGGALNNDIKFVTVSGYKDLANNSITTFENGKVYSFNLSCTYADLMTAPNVTTISSTATLNKKAWNEIVVTPEY